MSGTHTSEFPRPGITSTKKETMVEFDPSQIPVPESLKNPEPKKPAVQSYQLVTPGQTTAGEYDPDRTVCRTMKAVKSPENPLPLN